MLSFTETLLKEKETLENKTNIASEDIKMGLFQMRPFEITDAFESKFSKEFSKWFQN